MQHYPTDPEVSGEIARTRVSTDQAHAELARMRAQLDRLSLVCRAMWSLLQDTSGYTEADLMKRVEEVDLLDGKLDGRVQVPVIACPACGRNNGGGKSACIYCSTPLERRSAFD